jgi:hypothetical protein
MKYLILIFLFPIYSFAGVCTAFTSPDSNVDIPDRCKEGEVLDVTVRGTDKSSTVWLNSMKSEYCNHKHTISIFPNPDSLSLTCIYKNNRK